jgi:dTDP-4-dehydrorhamnose 3,5-epimerase and related enzymes
MIVVTGGHGFLGWHVRALARVRGLGETVPLGRASEATLAAAVDGAERVVHLAGVNRASPAEVIEGNIAAARSLAQAIRASATPPKTVVYANSIQAGNGTPYGDAKAAAAQILVEATRWAGSSFVDVRLPNIFAEHGRPYYNSVVATFCARLASGQAPEVHQDRELELMHATDAAAQLLGLEATPPTTSITVAELAARLTEFATVYRTGDMPALRSRFDVRLFNTYRSFLPPAPVPLPRRGDARGELVEAVRVRGGTGQTFCSTTRPGYTRGDHVHLAKVERFVVLRGEARITLRRLLHDEVVELRVTGDTPVAVDMPALWAHAITNVGSEELVTLFWANELFDPAAPDTYPEPVALSRPGVATSGPSGGSRP